MALLVAAGLAAQPLAALGDTGKPAPVQALPVEPGVSQANRQTSEPEDGNILLAVPLKLLSVLDDEFSLGPWTFRGYIQLDGADYRQAPAGPLESDFRRGAVGTGEAADARVLSDGSYLRRARFGGEGRLGEHLAYRAMFDIAGREQRGDARVAEVWASYSRFAPYVIQVGAFPQPANMEDATGADANLFLERATAANLARGLGGGDGRLGVTLRRSSKAWMGAISLTGPVLHEIDQNSPRAAVLARLSRSYYPSSDTSVHVGGGMVYVLSPGRSEDEASPGIGIRLIASPEVRVDDTPLIDTGGILARRASVLSLEFAARRRNFYVQAEAFRFAIERVDLSQPGEPHFFGFYLQGSWILTGENRRFDRSRAAFWGPKPRRPLGEGGWGAWELAFRYSRMDANFRAGTVGELTPPGGVRGGDQSIVSVGLDWFATPRIRLMLSGMHVRVDRLNPASATDPEPFGAPPLTPPVGVRIGQTLNIAALRLRYGF